jgi:hypothetical protein
MGMTHWTPNGGSVAECGAKDEDMLAVASMAGTNCPECRKMIMLSIDFLKHSRATTQLARSGSID